MRSTGGQIPYAALAGVRASPPHWRWRRAESLAADSVRDPRWVDDAPTLAAIELVRSRAGNASRAPPDADQAAALALFEADGPPRWRLEALILTGIPGERVAETVGLSPGVVSAFEVLFFDVRPRLKDRWWITAHTFGLGPYTGYAPGDLGSLWRWVGYYRGEQALDQVFAVTTGVGREKYTEEQLELAELFVLTEQLQVGQTPERIVQLHLRLRAEEIGAHPSTYHLSRRQREVPKSSSGMSSNSMTGPSRCALDVIGDLSLASHNDR